MDCDNTIEPWAAEVLTRGIMHIAFVSSVSAPSVGRPTVPGHSPIICDVHNPQPQPPLHTFICITGSDDTLHPVLWACGIWDNGVVVFLCFAFHRRSACDTAGEQCFCYHLNYCYRQSVAARSRAKARKGGQGWHGPPPGIWLAKGAEGGRCLVCEYKWTQHNKNWLNLKQKKCIKHTCWWSIM